jgi:hypothetical protein
MFIINFKNAFNQSVGCGRDFKRQEVADILDVSLSTIENWGNYDIDIIPKAEYWERLKYILGASYKNQIESFYEDQQQLEVDQFKILKVASNFLTEFINISADNNIDRTEARLILKEVPEVIEHLQKLLSYCNTLCAIPK